MKKMFEILKKTKEVIHDLINTFKKFAVKNKSFYIIYPLVVIYVFSILAMHTASFVLILTSPIFLIGLALLLLRLYRFLDSFSIKEKHSLITLISWWQVSIVVFLVYVFLVYYVGIYTSPDTFGQWKQVLTSKYSDWHPVIHTLTIWLFYKITHFYTGVILSFIFCFSLTCGWLFYTMQKYQYKMWIIFCVLSVIVFSPESMFIMRILWKDTAFGIALLLLTTAFINIYESNGQWLLSHKNKIFFLLMLVYGAFVRHNGIFFVIPFLILFPTMRMKCYSKTKRVVLCIIVFACMCIYVLGKNIMRKQGYIVTESNRSNQSFAESVGLPMSMLSEIIVRTPEKMPEAAKQFLYGIAPQEDWIKYYRGDFNSVKFATWSQSQTVFETITPREFLALFIRSIISSPYTAMNSFKHVTSLGWDPGWPNGVAFVGMELNFYPSSLLTFPLCCICAPGFWCLLIVVLCGYANKNIGWDAFVLTVPYIAYMIGTSMLLTGWDLRFFYGLLISIPPMLALLLGTYNPACKLPTTLSDVMCWLL